jgi:hypothetical protein
MDDEALLREKAATLTRMLNLQGTIGMFGHVSVRVPGTDKCFISPGASTDKTVVRRLGLPAIFAAGPLLLRKRTCTRHRRSSQTCQ